MFLTEWLSSFQNTNKSPKVPSGAAIRSIPDLPFSIRTMADDLSDASYLKKQPTVPQKTIKSPFLDESAPLPKKPLKKKIKKTEATPPKASPQEISQALEAKLAHPNPLQDNLTASDFAFEEKQSLKKPTVYEPTLKLSGVPQPAISIAQEYKGSSQNSHLGYIPTGFNANTTKVEPQKKHRWIRRVFLMLLMLGLFSAGGWALWTRKDTFFSHSFTLSSFIPTQEPPITNEIPASLPVEAKRSLSFETATVTPEQIRSKILSLSQEIKNSGTTNLVPVDITDENGAKVSFFIFTQWMKMTLPESLLSSLDESFTLYLYNDAGYIRAGLAVSTISADKTLSAMQSTETTIFTKIAPLFFDQPIGTHLSASPFASSSYKDIAIRYSNVSTPNAPFLTSLSLDYVIVNDTLIIGTSKQVGRTIIDKVLDSQKN